MAWPLQLRMKVFLAIFLPCVLASGAVTVGLTSLSLGAFREEFKSRYQALSDQVASTFHELELATDVAGRAALQNYRAREARGGFTSIAEMREFATAMGVSGLLSYSRDGLTALWTHPPVNPQFCVFDVCPGYTQFFSGQIDAEISPFVPVADAPPIKFFKKMSEDGEQLLNVFIYSEFLDGLLQSAFRDNKDVVGIDIRTPSGTSLRTGGLGSTAVGAGTSRFQSQTASTSSTCCQCVQKGLVEDEGGYFYNFVVDVSRQSIDLICARARTLASLAFLFAVGVSYVLARIISARIVARIEKIDRAAAYISAGNLDVEVAVQPQDDELGRLSRTLHDMLVALKKESDRAVADERTNSVAQHARQVAHDIRSPLAAIRMALSDLGETSEETRSLLRSATFRIEDISNQLFESHLSSDGTGQASNDTIKSLLLSSILELIVSEKRTEYRQRLGINIEFSADTKNYGLFVGLVASEFKRVISNLVNNSVEALEGTGTIRIRARRDTGLVCIEVEDDGCGIPPHILERLGREEITHGKTAGHGIGVFSAQSTLHRFGGQIDYASTQGQGTCARIRLPLADPPLWFIARLEFDAGCQVVVADDDLSIHRVWDERFRRSAPQTKMIHTSSPKDFAACVRAMPDDADVRYLVDFEFLGEAMTGLDLIRELGIATKSVLVTSRFEETCVVSGCQDLGVRMIPKCAAEHIPIRVTPKRLAAKASSEPAAVLLDDDALIRKSWTMAARRAGVLLKVFATEADLLEACPHLPRAVPLYVDFDLSANKTGLQVAEELVKRGFTRVYLATGFHDVMSAHDKSLAGVVGKNAPF